MVDCADAIEGRPIGDFLGDATRFSTHAGDTSGCLRISRDQGSPIAGIPVILQQTILAFPLHLLSGRLFGEFLGQTSPEIKPRRPGRIRHVKANGALGRTVGICISLSQGGRREMVRLIVIGLRKAVSLRVDPVVDADLRFKANRSFRKLDSDLARCLKIDAMLERLVGDAQRRIDARAEAAVDRMKALLNTQEFPRTEQRLRAVGVDRLGSDPISGAILDVRSTGHIEIDLFGAVNWDGDCPRRLATTHDVAME